MSQIALNITFGLHCFAGLVGAIIGFVGIQLIRSASGVAQAGVGFMLVIVATLIVIHAIASMVGLS